ncbi:MAG: hypothetical protein F7B60_06530 [Desulfurococcales archaeon]|nr:hypothetical protein [Desulfurococcales archaeon]
MPVKNILKNNPFSDIIIIPSSILSVEPTLELKTLTVSRIARILGIFQADGVIIYCDERKNGNFKTFCSVLKYLLMPPYLKKYVKKSETLRKVGIAYPLNLAIHNVTTNLKLDPIRLGLVVESSDRRVEVDIGLDKPIGIKTNSRYRLNSLILVNVNEGRIINEEKYYTGFTIHCVNRIQDLHKIILNIKPDGIFGTSVKGTPLERCSKCWIAKKRAFVFGGPSKGIKSIYKGIEYDEVLNTLKDQGTTTIRTEEAICITLSKLVKVISN